MISLLVDDREHNVIPYFKESYEFINIIVKRLTIGDYVIVETIDNIEKILFCFERKSHVDLSASIKDGRAENINKMIYLRDETNCKLFYLMEGKTRYAPGKRFSRIPFKNLQAKLDHLMIRDNIFVIHSNDEEDTVARLIEFATNYLSIKPTANVPLLPLTVSGGIKSDNISILSTNIQKTDLQITYNIWSSIPNITSKTATLFIADYHISDLFLGLISKIDISTMKYPNGTIIGKRADKIIAVVNNDIVDNYACYIRILAELPMITKKTAALILVQVKFNDLLRGALTLQEIADIKKTPKMRIGLAAATNIYKFLIKPVN